MLVQKFFRQVFGIIGFKIYNDCCFVEIGCTTCLLDIIIPDFDKDNLFSRYDNLYKLFLGLQMPLATIV